MTAYFDFSFLPLLLFRSARSDWAWGLVPETSEGHALNGLHLVQVENLFIRAQLQGTDAQRGAALAAVNLWRFYRDNLVFRVSDPSWPDVFRAAAGKHADISKPVPQPSHFLHAAAAAAMGCTHFLSVHPDARRVAEAFGLKVRPEKLEP